MRKSLCTLLWATAATAAGLCQTGTLSNASASFTNVSAVDSRLAVRDGERRLPIKRVILYKNGVGYFEHTGHVRGTQELSLDFTSSQLNDVLKSLTVVDLGEGQVTGVRYDSIAPLDERLRSLRVPFGQQTTRAEFLSALRGTRVEVRGVSTSAIGRVVSVEQRNRTSGKSEVTEEITELTIMTDAGELRTFDIGPATSVRVAERDLNEEIHRYLGVVSSARSKDLRRMVISTTGKGDRDLFVSYISEVPVWKSTYRVVLSSKTGTKPLLQGWAIVDNTVGEDWKDVQLSLVAGAPQSFIENISQPYYARRPVVALPQTAMLTPQSHEAAMDRLEPVSTMNAPLPAAGPIQGQAGPIQRQSETFSRSSPGMVPGGVGAGSGGGVGPGAVGGVVGGVLVRGPAGSHAAVNPFRNTIPSVGDRLEGVPSEAIGNTVGDLFQYDLKQRITIGKDQSALVPIVSARVDGEKVTLCNATNRTPVRALWLTNSSGLTLDSGTFSVVEDGTFAGEGLMATLKPEERRLISYAADTAVRITSEDRYTNKSVSRVVVARGAMRLTREEQTSKTYKVHNSDTAPRQVVIEHPVRSGWKLASALKPEETSASFYRFQITVAPGKTEEFTVTERHPLTNEVALSNLTPQEVEIYVREGVLKPELEQAFRGILRKKAQIGGLEAQLQVRRTELEEISADQSRLRENMKALKGSSEEKALLQRYTGDLNAQEDRLSILRKQIEDLKMQQEQTRAELDQMVLALAYDEIVSGT